MARTYTETHPVKRIGWLRAAVPGANGGILSTASLIVGAASASSDKGAVTVADLAGLVAGAALPLLVAAVVPEARVLLGVSLANRLALVALGAIGAQIGGAARVTLWGALALLATALVGWAFGIVV